MQPKPIVIPLKNLHPVFLPVAKHKKSFAKWVEGERDLHQGRQGVDGLPHVGGAKSEVHTFAAKVA